MTIDAKFEKISKYASDDMVIVPSRKTTQSAGYDFYAAEDTVIPPFVEIMEDALIEDAKARGAKYKTVQDFMEKEYPYSLEKIAKISKEYKAKVALVPTGIKCKIPDGYFLQLSPRSSLPLKHWLIMANGVGIIDADYYNNPDNEGHIYFQLINLLPVPVVIKKGERNMMKDDIFYLTKLCGLTGEEDEVLNTREGGFGSTNG